MTNTKIAKVVSIFVLLFIIGITITSFAEISGTTIEDAKLRKTASNDSIVLEIIPKDEEVEILEEQENWYRVNYKKIKGYVQKEQIKTTNETATNQVYTNSLQTNTLSGTNTVSLTPTNSSTSEINIGESIKTPTNIEIYIRPLINSKIVNNLEKDVEIKIVNILNGWLYIATDTLNGWVRLEDVKGIQPINNEENQEQEEQINQEQTQTEESKEEQETSEAINKTGYITATGINFRKEPNTDSEILKVFAQNAKVTILEEQGEWYKVEHKDEEGYVLKMYVSEKKVEVTSRSASERTENTESEEDNSTSAEEEDKQTSSNTDNNSTTTTSNKGQEIADFAKQYVGYRYVYGGSTPKGGFDCSGLTMYVYKQFGINLPHSATAQSKIGTKVEKSNIQPGDLVFFSDYRTYKGIGHVGIYIGDNKFVHASTEKTGVITSSLTSGSYVKRYVTATRLTN